MNKTRLKKRRKAGEQQEQPCDEVVDYDGSGAVLANINLSETEEHPKELDLEEIRSFLGSPITRINNSINRFDQRITSLKCFIS